MVIGRELEQRQLLQAMDSDESQFIAVYGRRRIGKTYLIRQTFKDNFAFQNAGLAKANKKEQLKEFADSLITTQNGVSLLPIAALYGANSSGKSNFLKALGVFTDLLRRSNSMNSSEEINVVPFLLTEHVDLNTSPSYFEIEVITPSNNFYRYGFEANRKSIVSEWLYKLSGSKETCLFVRENDSIGVTKAFLEGKGLEERTRNNALFLSVCDSFNGEIAKELVFDITVLQCIFEH